MAHRAAKGAIDTPPRSRAIAVLGMHRSGTSVATRVLQLLGAYLGEEEELMPPLPDNPAGHWERNDITHLHERILHALDTSWDTSFRLPDGWHRSAEVAPLRAELVDLVRAKFLHRRLWAWKDPRTTILFPLWKDVLEELGIALGCLLVTRHPLDVAKSLEKRDGFPIVEGVSIWLNYNLAMLENTSGIPRVFIAYDRLVDDWKSTLSPCSGLLQLPLASVSDEICEAIDSAVRKDLRHSVSTPDDLVRAGCPAPVGRLAGIVDKLPPNGKIEKSVQQRVRELIETHSSASDFYRHDILRANRQARSMEQHAANLENVRSLQLRETTRLSDESKALSSDIQRLAAANVALNEEVQRLRGLLQARNRSTRAEERLQELTQANAEVQALVGEKSRQLQEQSVELEQQRQRNAEQAEEIRLLRGSLEEGGQDVRSLQKEVDDLRRGLAQRDEQLQEALSTIKVLRSLQKEVDDLRRGLAQRDEQLQQALSAIKVLTRSVDDVYASQSWRITRPLRTIYDMLLSLGRMSRSKDYS